MEFVSVFFQCRFWKFCCGIFYFFSSSTTVMSETEDFKLCAAGFHRTHIHFHSSYRSFTSSRGFWSQNKNSEKNIVKHKRNIISLQETPVEIRLRQFMLKRKKNYKHTSVTRMNYIIFTLKFLNKKYKTFKKFSLHTYLWHTDLI